MPDGMRVEHAHAKIVVEVLLHGDLPLLETHRDETMGVQTLYLVYLSEDAQPWVVTWEAQGYDYRTGHALLDVSSRTIARAGWPGWLVDIIASHRPKTGDRLTLPEF
jgi:hypothetical protein